MLTARFMPRLMCSIPFWPFLVSCDGGSEFLVWLSSSQAQLVWDQTRVDRAREVLS